MGQVASEPSKGLKPLSRLGLSDSDRGKGLPERKQPMHVETKKKSKPKTAAAGGGANPPKPPTRGPKGPNWPGNDKNDKDYKKDKNDHKSMGGLTKGSRKEETKKPNKKK